MQTSKEIYEQHKDIIQAYFQQLKIEEKQKTNQLVGKYFVEYDEEYPLNASRWLYVVSVESPAVQCLIVEADAIKWYWLDKSDFNQLEEVTKEDFDSKFQLTVNIFKKSYNEIL